MQNVIVTVWQMLKLDEHVRGIFLELKMLNVVLIYGQVKQIISLWFSKRTLTTWQRSVTSSKLRVKTPEQVIRLNCLTATKTVITLFTPMSYFYTPWKRQKTKGFVGYRNRTLTWKGLTMLYWCLCCYIRTGFSLKL